ncbi:energy-coupling factor ABC transporter ATP-binding protein [Thermodesulforhabdus norvegica]|uniref:Biotin transport system ATP-binding protein n=1 Tax=Thermodesulforhabdus norvegica TaxID=39841 RepID=A0A1I4SAB5_9BACT|nr:ABC transporter ATP-binding protein [Thermodesulforhabdus norvegica]SFM61456.1 biotin transport system ATP-binding protein [Thermodesulforhabdus norvegica]
MIEIRNLTFTYPDGTVAFESVDLSIPPGSIFLVCGPNGSGKSSLLKAMAGLLKPQQGEITVTGCPDEGKKGKLKSPTFGLVFQNPEHQILGETVKEDVSLGLKYMGLPEQEIEKRVFEALEFCNLLHLAEKPCHLLSGGEKKRLSIASVLAMKPRVFLLDEPFANLDYPSTRSVLDCLIRLNREGHTLVVATHDLDVVAPYATALAILNNGRVACVSHRPEELFPGLEKYGVRPPCYALYGLRPAARIMS